jgi:hypothetical protein
MTVWGGHSCPPSLRLLLLFLEKVRGRMNVDGRKKTSQKRRTRVPVPHKLVQLLRQQFIDNLRAGLAFGGFHDLADEETEHGFLAGAVLLELFGVGG